MEVGYPEITSVANLDSPRDGNDFLLLTVHKAAKDARHSEQLTVAERSAVDTVVRLDASCE